jgi:2-oxo-4-hydroxy-4-carboxy-5-ureidoimidazoline decarboxylase
MAASVGCAYMERWQRIDRAPASEAGRELRICCAALRWIDRMLSRRPFGSADAARTAGRQEWFALSPEEWKEAFAGHPRIGDVRALRSKFAGASAATSAREQSGVAGADDALLHALLDGNRQYEARFGYIFIICATGRTAEQVLASLRGRLANLPPQEIRIAAEEHAKICDLRLTAWVDEADSEDGATE